MSRRVGAVVLVVLGLFAAGLLVVWIARGRVDQDRVYCANNLRELGQFAESYSQAEKAAGSPLTNRRDLGLMPDVPPGTVVNPALPPDQRMSWVVPLLPLLGQKRQDGPALLTQLDLTKPWDAEQHRPVAQTRLPTLVCPGNVPSAVEVTQYVGNGGVGPGAAELPLVPFPFVAHAAPVAPPRAGAFRYDEATPFGAFADGLSNSILFAEVSTDLGPWLRGGPATIRTLSTDPRPVIGVGGQFGGNHPVGGNFAFADGSVRFLTDRTSPAVLHGLLTIAGGGVDPLPGE